MEITELTRKGKSELYKTYVDGNYCCLLQAEIIVKNKIKVGSSFSQDDFLKIREESDELTCKTLGLDYISNGPKTRKQVFDHLKQKGYLPVSINKALDTLCSYGYISDKYYAEMFVKSKQEQKGKMYIKTALKQNSILDQSSIDSIIANGRENTKTLNDMPYPKGIQKKTLNLIFDYFKANTDWQSGDIIAEKLGLSIVTVRHYMNYLVEQNLIKEDINYSTGGRPCMLYKKK